MAIFKVLLNTLSCKTNISLNQANKPIFKNITNIDFTNLFE